MLVQVLIVDWEYFEYLVLLGQEVDGDAEGVGAEGEGVGPPPVDDAPVLADNFNGGQHVVDLGEDQAQLPVLHQSDFVVQVF